MSDFVLPISGEMSVGATLNGEVSIGSVIFNDYIITISDINGGHRLTARRGSDIQTMDILNGVDAPVPDIKITDVVHGHDVTITVGDVAKTFYIHDGVDAPVPEIDVEPVQGGHKVIAAVGDTVKSFTVKDGVDGRDGVDGKDGYTPVKGKDYFDGQPGKDGRDGVDGKNGVDGKTPVKGVDYFDGKDGYTPVKGKDYFDGQPGKDGISPVINVSDIENGHRVTITTDGDAQSFDVLNGKDGEDAEGGTVEVDPTLSIEGMAADAKATGDAVKPIAAILDTTTTNKIEWDGVIGDRLTVEMGNGKQMVHVSDFVPDTGMLVGQDITFTLTVFVEGTNSTTSGNGTLEKFTDDVYAVSDEGGPLVVIAKQAVDIPFNGATFVIPKAGVYFQYLTMGSWFGYITSVSSPLLRVHGGVKVKEEALPVYIDYNQHDTKSPGHILNRPFWPAWSPVLFSMDYEFYNADPEHKYSGASTSRETSESLTAPTEGKRYTFVVKGKQHSGIATSGDYSIGSSVVSGIGIVDEQDSNVFALYTKNVVAYPQWYFKFPSSEVSEGETAPLAVIEGDNAYNKLSAADDKLDMTGIPDGVSIVYDLTKIVQNAKSGDEKALDMVDAFIYDVEITIDMNGVETTLTSASLVFASDQNMMGFACDLYMYGEAPLAGIVHDGDTRLLALLDIKTVMGAGPTTKAFKVNYPGIFAPSIAAKKVPVECLPGALVVYTPILGQAFAFADYEGTINITCADIRAALRSGYQIYVRVVADIDAESAAKGYGEYYSVMRIEFFKTSTGIDSAMLMYEHKNGTRGYCEARD